MGKLILGLNYTVYFSKIGLNNKNRVMGNGPANVEKGIQRGMTQQSHVVLFHSYPFFNLFLDASFVSLSQSPHE